MDSLGPFAVGAPPLPPFAVGALGLGPFVVGALGFETLGDLGGVTNLGAFAVGDLVGESAFPLSDLVVCGCSGDHAILTVGAPLGDAEGDLVW